jgi:hypothetical protein
MQFNLDCKNCFTKENLKSFLCFQSMLTPWLIQVVFWVGLALIALTTIMNLFHGEYWQALKVISIGPLVLRLGCEMLILFFKINDNLSQIRHNGQQHLHLLSKMNRNRSRHKRPHPGGDHNVPNQPNSPSE